ncbi:MAG: energy transducer TonB [Prolixibacteraceae bacterium]
MKTKKNAKADLETKRKTFFLFGLSISLAAVLFAFTGTSEVKKIDLPDRSASEPVVEIFIPPTKPDQPLPPPPPSHQLLDLLLISNDPIDGPDPDFDFPEIDDPLPDPIQYTEEIQEEPTLLFAQQMPEFPGGMKNLNSWLSKNIKYPQAAVNLNVSGRVYLNFVVDKDGSISNIAITRGVDDLIDKEAMRVVATMPKWKPGFQNGKPVKVSYNIFITFQLN